MLLKNQKGLLNVNKRVIYLLLIIITFVSLPVFAYPDIPVMGVTLSVDATQPQKNKLPLFFKPKNMTMNQLVSEYRMFDNIKNVVRDKYSSRSLIVETIDNNVDLSQVSQNVNYKYITSVKLRIDYIDRESGFLSYTGIVKATCDIKITDIQSNNVIFSKTLTEKSKGGSSSIPDSLQIAINNCSIALANQIQLELPSI